MLRAERRRLGDRLPQLLDELLLVPDRSLRRPCRRRRSPAPSPGCEDADVVHDQAAVLAGEDAVGAGDGLHQRVVAHRLVEIDRRAARRVEAGHPHGADEDQPQRVLRVLELALEVLSRPCACGAARCRGPALASAAISFWPGETTTAMSVVVA